MLTKIEAEVAYRMYIEQIKEAIDAGEDAGVIFGMTATLGGMCLIMGKTQEQQTADLEAVMKCSK